MNLTDYLKENNFNINNNIVTKRSFKAILKDEGKRSILTNCEFDLFGNHIIMDFKLFLDEDNNITTGVMYDTAIKLYKNDNIDLNDIDEELLRSFGIGHIITMRLDYHLDISVGFISPNYKNYLFDKDKLSKQIELLNSNEEELKLKLNNIIKETQDFFKLTKRDLENGFSLMSKRNIIGFKFIIEDGIFYCNIKTNNIYGEFRYLSLFNYSGSKKHEILCFQDILDILKHENVMQFYIKTESIQNLNTGKFIELMNIIGLRRYNIFKVGNDDYLLIIKIENNGIYDLSEFDAKNINDNLELIDRII